MTQLETLLALPPYAMDRADKGELYAHELSRLTKSHFKNCAIYCDMLKSLNAPPETVKNAEKQPFLPVRLFKEFELKSVTQEMVQKTMTSSGTSGQRVSKIFLDKNTAKMQTKVLAKIVSDLIGPKRLPMLVIDAKETVKSRHSFSARGAGILGFSMFGRDVTFALDSNMQLNLERVQAFCEKYSSSDVFIFGFTSIIYQHFIQTLQQIHEKLDLRRAILLHGGGWKKLESMAIDNNHYKELLKEIAGIQRIHNYYGMVEQTGSIFTECGEGHLHCSIFSDIIIRDEKLNVAPFGTKGLVQLVSLLPESYPGHSILTEDMGKIIGEDDCACGRKGKYFQIYGRAKAAEIRGCSDTYAA